MAFLLPSDLEEQEAAKGTTSKPAQTAEKKFMLPSDEEEQVAAKEAARPSVNPIVEGGRAFMESWEGVKHGLGPAETPTEGPWSSFKRTGSGLLSAAALPFAFPMGVAKSALANVTAPALRAAEYGIKKGIQQVKPDFDPKVQTHQEAYEALLPGSEAALSGFGPAVGPRGAILPIAPVRKTPSGGLLTKGGQEVTAGKMLEKAATDPDAAIGALDAAKERIPGSRPTTFQASEDYGLGQLERVVQNTPEGQAAFQQRWAEQNNARVDALRSLQQDHVDPLTVSSTLRTAMQADDALAELELVAARARAEQRAAALGNDVPPEISGQVMRQELDQAHGRIRGEERAAWEGVDPNNQLFVNTAPVSNTQFRLYGEMSEAAAAGMTEAERTISGIISRYPAGIPFRDMRDLRSLVSTEMRKERWTGGESSAPFARLTQLRGAIQESVNNPVSAQTGALAPDAAIRLQQATDLTRRRADLFKQGPVEDVLKREGAAGPFDVTNAAVPNRFIPVGPKGYDHVSSYLRAVGNERGMPDIYDALVSDLRSKAMNPDGSINPDKLVRWAMAKQHALRAVTERDGGLLVQRLQNVEMAEQAIGEIAAQRQQLAKLHQEGIFGKLIGADNPTDIQNILGALFNRQTSVGDVQQIMARLRAAPEAQAGARQAVVDWIWDKFISNTAAGTTDENIIRADQFQNFIKLKQPVLEAFGFTPDQIGLWQKISDDMRQTKMSIDATKMRGGPGTAQDLNAMYQMREDLGQNLFRRIAYRLMAGSVGWAAEGPLGGAVAMFGAGVVSSMRDRGIKSVQDLVKNAMLNPATARRLLSRVRGREVNPWSRTWMGYEAAAQQQGQPQQPPPQGFKHGGAVRPPSRKGIQARNKARAVAARERSALARSTAQAKRKVKYADGGLTRGSEGGIGDAAATFASNPTLDAIERMHISRKIAQGQYDTQLAPDEETKYRQWKAQNAPQDSGADYDLRGAYRAGVTPDQTGHMPDTYKKPNHPTFSNQSKYATGADQARAGSWEGETYVPPRLANGGGVDADSSDPLNEELKRRNVPGGLSATAGPTVTSTTPVQDIPAPKVNAAGETLPTYVLKEMGKQLVGTPERLTHVGGDLQRRGEYAGSHEDLPSWGPPPEEMPAGLEVATGLYGFNAPFARPGLGIFGGKGAKTANLDMLKEAERMLKEGVPHADIRKQTGWEFGADEQPRFEMSDERARIKPEALHPPDELFPLPYGQTTLEKFVHHPEFFDDYPQLRGLPVEFDIGPRIKTESAGIAIGPNGQPLGIRVRARDIGTARSQVIHEMSHGVQQLEGFAPGANPKDLPVSPQEIRAITQEMAQMQGHDWHRLTPEVQAQMEMEVRHSMYEAHAGEAEARNAEIRRDYNDQKRADTPSWESEDVPRDLQIVRRGPGDVAGVRGDPFKPPKIYAKEEPPAAPLLKPSGKVEPVGLGQFPTTTPRKILSETKQGGYSVRVPTGERPTEGLMMGIYRNTDPRNLVVEGRAPTQADVRQHATRNIEALQKPERHYGTWKDPETGITYFDVSQRFPAGNIRQATKFGERTGQLSGYNVGKGETFPVGNWEKFITDPEFHNRVIEQAQKGREYLSQYPAKEWWDMHGGPFENVYGTQNMPQTAGFTASTAPNTKPIENLQHMSEYMRRHIRGEPVVQPTWRAPEGNMSLAAGKKMPLEQSRVANLIKSAAGNLDALQMRKVRSEALAMWGDPRAVVLDRHWARIGEAPERGIYTATTEGVISSRPLKKGRLSPYELMENEIVKIADSLGRDPRDFSADGWTGIRETIRTTGELYGQRFRGAAIQGESKSYADHFVDLIQRKAGMLRMSVNELERRLRGGDANLLSQMLTMPTIAGAFSYWLAGQGSQEQNGAASNAGTRAMSPTL